MHTAQDKTENYLLTKDNQSHSYTYIIYKQILIVSVLRICFCITKVKIWSIVENHSSNELGYYPRNLTNGNNNVQDENKGMVYIPELETGLQTQKSTML